MKLSSQYDNPCIQAKQAQPHVKLSSQYDTPCIQAIQAKLRNQYENPCIQAWQAQLHKSRVCKSILYCIVLQNLHESIKQKYT